MTKFHILACLFTLGCGKTSIDALCEDSCANGEAYAVRCADELDQTANLGGTECAADCIEGGKQADAAGCTDEYRALLTCYKNTNVETLECSMEALTSTCSAENAAMNTCIAENGGWDSGGWDTGR